MRIETDRLILRNYKMTDLNDYIKLISQEKVANHAGFDSCSDPMIGLNKLKNSTTEQFMFAIVNKQDNKVIGEIALCDMSMYIRNMYGLNRDEYAKELQCCLSEDFWNKGIMSEAMSAVVKFAFVGIGLDTLVAASYSKNKASEKVQIKCGLIPYKTDKNYVWRETGESCKAVLAKMTKEQYKHIGWYKDLQIKIEDANESGK